MADSLTVLDPHRLSKPQLIELLRTWHEHVAVEYLADEDFNEWVKLDRYFHPEKY